MASSPMRPPFLREALSRASRETRRDHPIRCSRDTQAGFLHPNFHEKAHYFVKSTWRLFITDERNNFYPSRYSSIRTVRGLTRSLVTRCIG
jgi:hypothetical protein